MLPAELKNFLFNMTQGRLYLNNVLQRINPAENDGICTFCRLEGVRELQLRGINEDRPEYLYYLNLLPNETVNHILRVCTCTRGDTESFQMGERNGLVEGGGGN